ncbi:MAG: hypothetical protein Q4E12_07220 [Coriobacteriia bacterium]|nr:hypothetical protein [Coriobacteriia bacterium]MDO4183375.1 hypothetical protein [Coriobacteriia bacterium]
MSLGNFFIDCVYIPLGGNRCSVPRWLLVLWNIQQVLLAEDMVALAA